MKVNLPQQALMDLIRQRHSVRSFQNRPIAADTASQLKEFITSVNQESGLHVQFFEDANNVFNSIMLRLLGWKHAPACIVMVGPDVSNLDEVCGYYGEKIVIHAQGLGLNTCWAGMGKVNQVDTLLSSGERIVIPIAVGYGTNQGRERASKTVEQVSATAGETPTWFIEGINAALLAPTAINQQKFIFELHGDGKVSAKVSARGPFVELDLGIVEYHFDVGSGGGHLDIPKLDKA